MPDLILCEVLSVTIYNNKYTNILGGDDKYSSVIFLTLKNTTTNEIFSGRTSCSKIQLSHVLEKKLLVSREAVSEKRKLFSFYDRAARKTEKKDIPHYELLEVVVPPKFTHE